MRIFGVLLSLVFITGLAVGQGEITPPVEKTFDYKDWVFKSLDNEKDVNLRKFTNGKKLVMVVYWAPWCPNWEYDVKYVQSLYDKYKDSGFDVIGVGEYAQVESMKAHIKKHSVTFTNVYESTLTADREKTTHFAQRREAGDIRKWGSPWYVFLEPKSLEPEGQNVMSKKTMVVNGELKRDEVENLIRHRLGLGAAGNVAARPKAIEVCEPETNVAIIKP